MLHSMSLKRMLLSSGRMPVNHLTAMVIGLAGKKTMQLQVGTFKPKKSSVSGNICRKVASKSVKSIALTRNESRSQPSAIRIQDKAGSTFALARSASNADSSKLAMLSVG